MMRKYKNIMLMGVLFALSSVTPVSAGLLDWFWPKNEIKFSHTFTKQDMQEFGQALQSAMPMLGQELKEAAPLYGQEAKAAIESGAQKIIDNAPMLAAQVKISCDQITKTAKIISNPLKTVPLSCVGVASTIAGFALLHKSLNEYFTLEMKNIDGTLENEQHNERTIIIKKGLAGAALIVAGLVTIIKSDAIVNSFA